MEIVDFCIPRELSHCEERFYIFYKAKNESRNLKWLYALGHVEMHLLFTQKRYQLVTTVAQAAILCLFNEVEALSCAALKKRTNLDPE